MIAMLLHTRPKLLLVLWPFHLRPPRSLKWYVYECVEHNEQDDDVR